MTEYTIENSTLSLTLNDGGNVTSLIEKEGPTEYHHQDTSFSKVKVSDVWRESISGLVVGDQLTLGFNSVNTELVYTINSGDSQWLYFTLDSIVGNRPTEIDLLRVHVSITEHNTSLPLAWNNDHIISLRPTTMAVGGRLSEPSGSILTCYAKDSPPGPVLEGNGVAISIAPSGQFQTFIHNAAELFGFVTNSDSSGNLSSQLANAKKSYLFSNFGYSDVDSVIHYCRKAGIEQVLIGETAWSNTIGQYDIHSTNWPGGSGQLKESADKFIASGINLGLHFHGTSCDNDDAYVTPIPHSGLAYDESVTLSGCIGDSNQIINTNESLNWAHTYKYIWIDDELITYTSASGYSFTGCSRGVLGTTKDSHSDGSTCKHLINSTSSRFVLDQSMNAFTEMQDRIALIGNLIGSEMWYHDGAEGVDTRRSVFFRAQAHSGVVSRIDEKPVIYQTPGLSPPVFQLISRNGQYDRWPHTDIAAGNDDPVPSWRSDVDLRVTRIQNQAIDQLMYGDFGWYELAPLFQYSTYQDFEGTQYDQWEYLLCKSLAYSSPIGLQTSPTKMAGHNFTDDLLELFKQYETLRLAETVPNATLVTLQSDVDFIKVPDSLRLTDNSAEFVEVSSVVCTNPYIKARIGSHGGSGICSMWHLSGQSCTMSIDVSFIEAYNVSGDIKSHSIIDHERTVLWFSGLSVADATSALELATFTSANTVNNMNSSIGSISVGDFNPRPDVIITQDTVLENTSLVKSWDLRLGEIDPNEVILHCVGDCVVQSGTFSSNNDAFNNSDWSVRGNLIWRGSADSHLSVSATSDWNCSVSGGAIMQYCDVAYCHASGGSQISVYNGIDNENNQNVRFLTVGDINDKPYVQFDGGDLLRYEIGDYGEINSSGGTLAIVFQTGSDIFSSDQTLFGSASEATSGWYWDVGVNGSGQCYVEVNDNQTVDRAVGNTILNTDTGFKLLVSSDGVSWFMRLNEEDETLVGINSGKWLTNIIGRENFTVGCLKHSSESRNFTGRVYDVMLYSGIKSDLEISRIEQYLKNRYNI